MQEREPLYNEVADIIVDTDFSSAKQIAVQIIEKFEQIKGK